MRPDPFFVNRAAECRANILAAQCLDLGLTAIQRQPDGLCSARLGDVTYTFAWDWDRQQVRLVDRVHDVIVVEIVA